MHNRWRTVLVCAGAVGISALAACGDDDPMGPQFGDLEFTPSFENIGSGRTVELTLSNASTVELGPVLIGLDVVEQTTMPENLCSTIPVNIAPSTIASLAAGADATIDVQLDTSDVDLDDCPPAQYDADIFAAVGNSALGGATVRFDWDGTPP